MQTEKREFRAHQHLIVQQIKNQAGTLTKALLEAVMNGIDAGASRIDVTITPDSFEVRDDGCGIQDRKLIEEFFEMFGTPHQEGDAKFGRFRIGRGQLFAFAVNQWRTGPFVMDVDFNKHGLNYELTTLKTSIKGTIITGKLYERQTANGVFYTAKELADHTKYVDCAVWINGKQTNTPAAKLKWDTVTDEAFIRRRENGMVDFYQQGVFVESLHASMEGGGGTIVTKSAVELNTARNQVLRSCPRFKRIMAAFREESKERISKKARNSAEQEFL